MTIQSHLTRLVLASLVPAAIAAVLLIGYSYERHTQSIHEQTVGIARALTQAVDRELASGRTALQALSTSPHLAAGNLAAFHAQARQALPDLPGDNVVLTDASGQQVLNTLRDFGRPLPPHGNPVQMRRVFDSGRPMVSDLFFGEVARHPLIAVDVPVRLDGRVAYVMSMGFFPERLSGILKRQQLPQSWVVAIFDSQGTVVARTHRPDRYVGQKGTPALMEALAQRAEGDFEGPTLEGIPTHTAFSRSSESNWSVAIGIPKMEFAQRLYSSLLWIVAGSGVLLLLGMAFAQRLARRIQGAIRGLIPPAAALARGEEVTVPPLRLGEAEEVAGALAGASRILREREEVLAVVTHDLRSPLNTMTMLAAAVEMEARKLGAQGLCESASLMRDTARGMSGLVDDLLAITVAQHGQSMVQMASVNAAEVIAKATQVARPLIEHAGLTLQVSCPDDLPQVQVDVDRIVRVFRNLLDNAVKFTDTQGLVIVAAEARPGCVRFSVANSGPALPAEQLQSMFRVFWQAKADRRGTGLGLSISRAIVDIHGGHIWAEAQAGMRVRMCVELPQPPTAAPRARTDLIEPDRSSIVHRRTIP